MKKILLLLIAAIIFLFTSDLKSQNWSEGFEGIDSLHLPAGWSKWHRSNFPIDTMSDWRVRDTGRSLPGLSTAKSKAHSGLFAIGISWVSGVNDTNSFYGISDEWLVTKRIHVWAGGSYLSFWYAAGGGSAPYLDSVQIWVSTVDSTPQSFTHYIITISDNGPFGEFSQEFIPFDDFIGQNIWVGFRYNMDVSVDGYFVHLDDIVVQNPIGIKPLGSEVPIRFDLKQNYPNPFNPTTNIEFDIAKSGYVNLIIYNSIGQEVKTLVNQDLNAGSYRVDFNAGNLPSGTYFYRLTAGDFVKTNKMVIVK